MRWPRVEIGSVCLPTETRDPRVTPKKTFRYVDIASINRASKTIENASEMSGEEAPSRARKEIRKGDVLVSTVRPNLNAVAIVPEDLDREIASTGFCVLRPDTARVMTRFLFHFVQAPFFVDSLVAKVRGAHYPAVSESDVSSTVLPLPTLREQARIVEILDQADRLRRLRAEADARAERILPTLFVRMFGDPAKNQVDWPRVHLGGLLEAIDSGKSPNCESRAARQDEWGVLKLGAVTWGRYDESQNKALLSLESVDERHEVKPGDLLFGRKNTMALVGACAYVVATRARLLLPDLIFRLRIKDGAVDPVFLWGLLSYPSKRPAIEALASGSAGSMPNISKARLEELTVEVPPFDIQRRYASAALSILKLEVKKERVSSFLDRTFARLLSDAFSGDLTARWREVHAAEVLAEMQEQARALGLPEVSA